MAGFVNINGTGRPLAHIANFGDCMVPVRRRAADITVSRSGQQGDHGFRPVGRPDKDGFSLPHSAGRQIGGQSIDRGGQFRPGKGAMAAAQRDCVWPVGGMGGNDVLNLQVAPHSGRVMLLHRRRAQRRIDGSGHASIRRRATRRPVGPSPCRHLSLRRSDR